MAQLARGDHDSVSAAPSPSSPPQESVSDAFAASKQAYHEDSDGNNSNVGHPKKPAWSKPLNGVVPVMGDAVSWPALSEATKPPSKSTPDLSNPNESVSASQAPVMSNPTQNQKKHANTNSNPNSAANPKSPARQRSLKRGGGTRAGPVQNGFIRAAPPPPSPPLPLPQPPPPIFPLFDLPYGALPAVPDYFPYNGNNWEGMPMGGFVPQSSSVSYQSSPRSSSRRGNFGGHHNGRNASRSSNVRDVRVPQQIAPPRGFLRPAPPPPPPGSIPFIRPHHVGPFGYPMGFDMPFPFVYVPTPPMESFNEVPFSAQALPMPPLSSTVLDDPMRASLVNQIDYYFCDDNLSRDDFLRSKMDDEGWVPLSLIAGFPKVQQWTNDIEVIFNSLKASSVVEVQPHNVRRRDEWKKWVSTPSRFAAGSGSQSTMGSTEKTITSSLLKVTLDEAAANKSSVMSEADSSTKVVPCTSTSEEVTDHANLANGDTTIEESYSSHL